MKKLVLAVIAVAMISVSSCKKDQGATPEANSAVKVLDKKDTAQWD